MSESWVGTIAFFGWSLLGVGCWLYMVGGRARKWIRRFVGALFCAGAVVVEAVLAGVFSPWMLLDYPMTIGSFSLGYGSDVLKTKIAKRSIVALTSVLSGVLLCVILGEKAWLLLPLHAVIATGSIYLGVVNPIQAAAEEFFVCALLRVCNIMYIFSNVLIKP